MATQWTAGTVSGQVLTAATMNTIGAAWEAFTPTLVQGVAVGKTVNYAKYCQIQKTVFVQVWLTATGAGLGGTVVVGLPAIVPVSQTNVRVLGSLFLFDAAPGIFYQGSAMVQGNTLVGFGYGSTNNMGANTPAFTIAAGDVISYSISYEVA